MRRYLICNKCHSIFEEPDYKESDDEEVRCPYCDCVDLDTLDVDGSIPSAEKLLRDE